MFHEIENHITRSKMSNREMVKEMNKEEIIDLMLESINSDNRDICRNAGMSDEETNTQIDQSQPALIFMVSNMYQKLKESGVIA
jgi:hypothetical protein